MFFLIDTNPAGVYYLSLPLINLLNLMRINEKPTVRFGALDLRSCLLSLGNNQTCLLLLSLTRSLGVIPFPLAGFPPLDARASKQT